LTIFEIGNKRYRFGAGDARLALAGYAFGSREVMPSRAKILRGAFSRELAPVWGYRTYDCVLPSTGEDFSDLDILVAAGLNGRLDAPAVAALQLATRRAFPALADAASAGKEFADLSSEELGDRPAEGTVGRLLAEAWLQMMATPNVGVALTHKYYSRCFTLSVRTCPLCVRSAGG
jgi:hypothetical protein